MCARGISPPASPRPENESKPGSNSINEETRWERRWKLGRGAGEAGGSDWQTAANRQITLYKFCAILVAFSEKYRLAGLGRILGMMLFLYRYVEVRHREPFA